MPKITAQGKIFECESGANLRQVLLKNKVNPHNGNAALINCRGIGTCGTCAVAIAGKVSSQNWREKLGVRVIKNEKDFPQKTVIPSERRFQQQRG